MPILVNPSAEMDELINRRLGPEYQYLPDTEAVWRVKEAVFPQISRAPTPPPPKPRGQIITSMLRIYHLVYVARFSLQHYFLLICTSVVLIRVVFVYLLCLSPVEAMQVEDTASESGGGGDGPKRSGAGFKS